MAMEMNLVPCASDIVLLRELYIRMRAKASSAFTDMITDLDAHPLIHQVQRLYAALLRAAIVPRADRHQPDPDHGGLLPPSLDIVPTEYNTEASELLSQVRLLLYDDRLDGCQPLIAHQVEFDVDIITVDAAHRALVRGELTSYSETHPQMVFELQQLDTIAWTPTSSDSMLLRRMSHYMEKKNIEPQLASRWLFDCYSQAIATRTSDAIPMPIQSLNPDDLNVLQADALDGLIKKLKIHGADSAVGPPTLINPLRMMQTDARFWTRTKLPPDEASRAATRFAELYATPMMTLDEAQGPPTMDRLYIMALEAIQATCGMTEDMLLANVDNIESVRALLMSMNLPREHWGPVLEKWGKRKAQVETMLQRGLQPSYFSSNVPEAPRSASAPPSSRASSQADAGSTPTASPPETHGDAPIVLVRDLHGRANK